MMMMMMMMNVVNQFSLSKAGLGVLHELECETKISNFFHLELAERVRISSQLEQELSVVISTHAPEAQDVLLVLAFVESAIFELLLL